MTNKAQNPKFSCLGYSIIREYRFIKLSHQVIPQSPLPLRERIKVRGLFDL